MFDGLKAALHRLQGVSAPRVVASLLGMAKNILPYSRWAALPKRKAAESAGTRQNRRWEAFKAAYASAAREFYGEPRRARRRIARAVAKQTLAGLRAAA